MSKSKFFLIVTLLLASFAASAQLGGDIRISEIENQTFPNTIQIDCDRAASEAATTTYFIDDGGRNGNCTTTSYDKTLVSNNAGSISIKFTDFNIGTGVMTIKDAISQVVLVSNATGQELRNREFRSMRGGLQIIFNPPTSSAPGWIAKVWCGEMCPQFNTNIAVSVTSTTVDGGTFYDVCQNTDITFNAANVSQGGATPNVQTYNWAIISQRDTTWRNDAGATLNYSFVEEGGYYVMCDAITDGGCYNRNINRTAVRVSLNPTFENVSFGPDSVCPGTQVTFQGEPTPPDWSLPIPEIVSGATFLPDGNNTCYNTDLEFDIFGEDQRVTSINDIESIYVNIEHSYMGDLSMLIRCPNGNQCLLKAYSSSTPTNSSLHWTGSGNGVSGSSGGSGTHLGLAPDPTRSNSDCYTVRGEGWPYYFTPTGTTAFGGSPNVSVRYTDPCDESSTSNVQDSSRRYGSYQSMSSLIGCPLNGTWTIYVCDHLGQDNGWIFEWGLYFRDDLYPNDLWTFGNTYDPALYRWEGTNIAVTGTNGVQTARVQNSDNQNMGLSPYTFYATDNFGCTYDTTVIVHVLPSMHPSCCIPPEPNVFATNTTPCSNTTHLSAGQWHREGNTGRWTATGPGTANFTSPTNFETDVTVSVYGDYTFTWDEFYQGNETCTGQATVNVNFAQQMDATLAAVDSRCRSGAPITFSAPNIGTLTCSPETGAFNQGSLSFNPLTATPGQYTISNIITGERCADPNTHNITFQIYDELRITGAFGNGAFDDCVDLNSPQQVGVHFNVNGVGNTNNPPAYNVTGTYVANGTPGTLTAQVGLTNTNWQIDLPSPLDYSFVVQDANGCSTIPVVGYFACDCPYHAGNFTSIAPTIACGDTAITIGHDGQQGTDEGTTDGQFTYIICTDISNTEAIISSALNNGGSIGGEGMTTLSRSGSGYTCEFGVQYYLIGIMSCRPGTAALQAGASCCRSMTQPKPIMWKPNPTPTVRGDVTCGKTITLQGSPLGEGEVGYWSVPRPQEIPESYSYTTIENTTNNMPNAVVLSSHNGQVLFQWNVQVATCTGSASAIYNFKAIPRPNAGADQVVCGNQANLQGTLTTPAIEGSTVQWTMNGGTISPASNSAAQVTANASGTFPITFTEQNGNCRGSDVVEITFVNIPQPITTEEVDTVCGSVAELVVYNTSAEHDGRWTVYNSEEFITSNIVQVQSYRLYGSPGAPSSDQYPHCFVTVPFPETVTEVTYWFVWREPINNPNLPADLPCFGQAVKKIVFRKAPVVSANICEGNGNRIAVCGNEVCIDADGQASEGYTTYQWITKDIPGAFADSSQLNTSFVLDSTVNIPGYLDVELYITARNATCMAIDTLFVRFVKKPKVNAGLDYAVCGQNYTLNGSWGIPPTETYTPSCRWSVVDGPANMHVTWANNPADSIQESVQASGYGIYTFCVREYNTAGAANTCEDFDTVRVEFLRQPIAYAGPDFNVCGLDFQMNALPLNTSQNDNLSGAWICISGGNSTFVDQTSPTTEGHYSDYGPAEFQWVVTNHSQIEGADARTCQAIDDVVIHFYEQPTSSLAMSASDTIACGLDFSFLRANPASSRTGGMWYENNPFTLYGGPGSPTQNNDSTAVTVSSYGEHTFYWVAYSGPEDNPRFCRDTSEGWTVLFIENPTADIALDTITFCSLEGQLQVNFNGIGTGVWSSDVGSLDFDDYYSASTRIVADTYNSNIEAYPYYTVYWDVQNSQFCTDRDSAKIKFARVPSDSIKIIPPKCFGEPAIITAYEDSLATYHWDFGTGIVDTLHLNDKDGEYRAFVYWEDREEVHTVGLISVSQYGCQSNIGTAFVNEPMLPEYNYNIIMDTCALGKGGVQFLDTLGMFAFYWIDTTAGLTVTNPEVGTPITNYRVYNLPQGRYTYRSTYQTFNNEYSSQYNLYFGNLYCHEYPVFEVGTIGMIEAEFAVSAEVILANLVAPDAKVTFVNSTNYDNVSKRCEWHYGDGEIEKNCDEFIQHTYKEPGCYEPYLIVMNRDLQECRDTAFLDECVFIDKASKLEVPNIFSPNGDGVNDFFQVEAETLKEFHGSIINRYGRQVFEWTDWENKDAGWDGLLNGSTKATPGVYFYIIKAVGYDGVEYELEGSLHLVK